jgi:anti-sigma factor RsiW
MPRLTALIEGRADTLDERQVRQHLQECAACAADFAALRSIDAAVEGLMRIATDATAFDRGVMARIDAEARAFDREAALARIATCQAEEEAALRRDRRALRARTLLDSLAAAALAAVAGVAVAHGDMSAMDRLREFGAALGPSGIGFIATAGGAAALLVGFLLAARFERRGF